MRTFILIVLALFLHMPVQAFAQTSDQITIARVDNVIITLDDLDKAVKAYNAKVSASQSAVYEVDDMIYGDPGSTIDTKAQKIYFLKQELIDQILFYQEAVRRGLDKTPEMQEKLSKATSEKDKRLLLCVALAVQESESSMVTENEARRFYEQNRHKFKMPQGKEKPFDEMRKWIITFLRYRKEIAKLRMLASKLRGQAKIEIFEGQIE